MDQLWYSVPFEKTVTWDGESCQSHSAQLRHRDPLTQFQYKTGT